MYSIRRFIYYNEDLPRKSLSTTILFFLIAFWCTWNVLTSLVLTSLFCFAHLLGTFVLRTSRPTTNFSYSRKVSEVIEEDSDFDENYDDEVEDIVNVHDGVKLERNYHQAIPGRTSFDLNMEKSVQRRVTFSDTVSDNKRAAYLKNAPSPTAISPFSRNKTPVENITRIGLTRKPLRPSKEINTFSTTPYHYQKGTGWTNAGENENQFRRRPFVISNWPQTSSPFEKSYVDLPSLQLSGVYSSPLDPVKTISPIESPVEYSVNEFVSPGKLWIDPPSPKKGLGLPQKSYPLHQRYTAERQNLHKPWTPGVRGGLVQRRGRPKLQSPVTVRIASPSRTLVQSFKKTYSPAFKKSDSCTTENVVSAIRQKRKRGTDATETHSQWQGRKDMILPNVGHQKRRRVDTEEFDPDDTTLILMKEATQPKPDYSAVNKENLPIVAENPSAKSSDELNDSFGKIFGPRNPINSSLSSSNKTEMRKRKTLQILMTNWMTSEESPSKGSP